MVAVAASRDRGPDASGGDHHAGRAGVAGRVPAVAPAARMVRGGAAPRRGRVDRGVRVRDPVQAVPIAADIVTTSTVYFGRPWGKPQGENVVHVSPPVGRRCVQCAEPIAPADRGAITCGLRVDQGHLVNVPAPVHMECAVRCAVGGIAPLLGMETPWQGTYRQEAQRVLFELNQLRRQHNLGPL